MRKRRVLVDMHTHCEYSFDSRTTIAAQAKAVRTQGLDVVCATDHNTIEGALRLQEAADGFRVIVGEEIGTRDGELIALFVERALPAERSAEETIARIHEQGGLVSVPHPFSRGRPSRIRRDALDRLWPLIDCIEVFNGRETSASANREAAEYARSRRIPAAVGSDAHSEHEVGRAWIEIDDFANAAEFLRALQEGVVHAPPRSPLKDVLARFDAVRRVFRDEK